MPNRIEMNGLEGEIFLDGSHPRVKRLDIDFRNMERLAEDLLYDKYEGYRKKRNLSIHTVFQYLKSKYDVIEETDYEGIWKLRSRIHTILNGREQKVSIEELVNSSTFIENLTQKLRNKIIQQ